MKPPHELAAITTLITTLATIPNNNIQKSIYLNKAISQIENIWPGVGAKRDSLYILLNHWVDEMQRALQHSASLEEQRALLSNAIAEILDFLNNKESFEPTFVTYTSPLSGKQIKSEGEYALNISQVLGDGFKDAVFVFDKAVVVATQGVIYIGDKIDSPVTEDIWGILGHPEWKVAVGNNGQPKPFILLSESFVLSGDGLNHIEMFEGYPPQVRVWKPDISLIVLPSQTGKTVRVPIIRFENQVFYFGPIEEPIPPYLFANNDKNLKGKSPYHNQEFVDAILSDFGAKIVSQR